METVTSSKQTKAQILKKVLSVYFYRELNTVRVLRTPDEWFEQDRTSVGLILDKEMSHSRSFGITLYYARNPDGIFMIMNRWRSKFFHDL